GDRHDSDRGLGEADERVVHRLYHSTVGPTRSAGLTTLSSIFNDLLREPGPRHQRERHAIVLLKLREAFSNLAIDEQEAAGREVRVPRHRVFSNQRFEDAAGPDPRPRLVARGALAPDDIGAIFPLVDKLDDHLWRILQIARKRRHGIRVADIGETGAERNVRAVVA